MIPFDLLERRLAGDLYTDFFRRQLLATDGSIFEELPSAVAYPRGTPDVVEIVRFAGEHTLSVHARGAGSGVCGGALGRGIIVDFTRYMNRMLTLDREGMFFECQPGFRMGELEACLAGSGLFFPPDPSSGEYASFGGMYATNASGAHSVKYGNVGDYCLDAEIVTARGQVVEISGIEATDPGRLPPVFSALADLYLGNREKIESAYPPVRYNATGYNLRGLVGPGGNLDLTRLFAGAEGTLGLVTRLKFRLLKKNPQDILVVAYFDDIVTPARATQKILPLNPCGIEILDKSLLSLARNRDKDLDRMLPQNIDNLLLIAFDEPGVEDCLDKARSVKEILEEMTGQAEGRIHIAFSPEEKQGFWAIRKAAVPILYRMKGEKKVLALIEDATVPTDRLVEYFEGIYRILGDLGVQFVLFGHIAKGLLHTRPMMNMKEKKDVDLLGPVSDRIFNLVRSLGGAISGEHGDGRLRSVYIRDQYPDIYPLFRQVKDLMDPDHLFNPDIITGGEAAPFRFSSLRYGPSYRAQNPYEDFLFSPRDLVPEIEKCHGCSKCTTVTRATRMCPVYKVLRDEAAAPKAKANILRALISGAFYGRDARGSGSDQKRPDPPRIMEKQAYVQGLFHVLDHCINCGSCSHECPSQVNIPKMVMEARANYQRRFGSKFSDHILTSAATGSAIVSTLSGALPGPLSRGIPGMTRSALAHQGLRRLVEKTTGISSHRRLDPFAPKPLRKRVPLISGHGSQTLVFFAGCYASFIRPEIGQAALRLLRAAGFSVMVPDQHCCGLPMISKGMSAKALAAIGKNCRQWADMAAGADHIVTTCSSCLLALTEYWPWFLGAGRIRPGSETAVAIGEIAGKTVQVTQVLAHIIPAFKHRPMRLAYHTPCHLKAAADPGASARLLARVPGMELDRLVCHCCGMAGTWGMMAEHDDLSAAIGSDLRTRLAESKALYGATDCPTCRMQMESFSRKPIFHPVEILADRI